MESVIERDTRCVSDIKPSLNQNNSELIYEREDDLFQSFNRNEEKSNSDFSPESLKASKSNLSGRD